MLSFRPLVRFFSIGDWNLSTLVKIKYQYFSRNGFKSTYQSVFETVVVKKTHGLFMFHLTGCEIIGFS